MMLIIPKSEIDGGDLHDGYIGFAVHHKLHCIGYL